jgi:hypothetical protein
MLRLVIESTPALWKTPYSDCPVEAVVLFSTVSVSSVHVPALIDTPMPESAGGLTTEEELSPLLHVVQLPPENVQPPWMVMLAAFVGKVTCSLPYEPLSR